MKFKQYKIAISAMASLLNDKNRPNILVFREDENSELRFIDFAYNSATPESQEVPETPLDSATPAVPIVSETLAVPEAALLTINANNIDMGGFTLLETRTRTSMEIPSNRSQGNFFVEATCTSSVTTELRERGQVGERYGFILHEPIDHIPFDFVHFEKNKIIDIIKSKRADQDFLFFTETETMYNHLNTSELNYYGSLSVSLDETFSEFPPDYKSGLIWEGIPCPPGWGTGTALCCAAVTHMTNPLQLISPSPFSRIKNSFKGFIIINIDKTDKKIEFKF